MTTRREFQIRKTECLALQLNTCIKLFDGRAFPNCQIFHPPSLFLRWACRYLHVRRKPARHKVLQINFSAKQFEQFTTDNYAKLVDVWLTGRRAVFRIENSRQ